MKSRDLFVPALALLGGAVIGRLIGVKPLLKGALAAANFAGYGPRDLAHKAAGRVARKVSGKMTAAKSATRRKAHKAPHAKTVAHAAAARRPIQKKSKPV